MEDLKLYNIEMEQTLFSTILVSPEFLPEIMEKLKVEDFYDPKHKIIYSTLIKLANKQVKIFVDPIVLIDELKISNQLNLVGGVEYIEKIISVYTLGSNYIQYVNNILEYSRKRKISGVSEYINSNLLSNQSNELLDDIQVKISNIYNENTENSLVHINELITRYKEEFEKRDQGKKIETGIIRYDELTNGLKEGNMLILGTLRPSVGKTALCLNIALAVAKKRKMF